MAFLSYSSFCDFGSYLQLTLQIQPPPPQSVHGWQSVLLPEWRTRVQVSHKSMWGLELEPLLKMKGHIACAYELHSSEGLFRYSGFDPESAIILSLIFNMLFSGPGSVLVSPTAVLREGDLHRVRAQVAEGVQGQPGAGRRAEARGAGEAREESEDEDQGERVREAALGGQGRREAHRRGPRGRGRDQVGGGKGF